jgi:hypothetical protein
MYSILQENLAILSPYNADESVSFFCKILYLLVIPSTTPSFISSVQGTLEVRVNTDIKNSIFFKLSFNLENGHAMVEEDKGHGKYCT